MSNSTGRPPVEPMTNAAWSRVERGLFERLDHADPLPALPALPAARARWPYIVIPAFMAAAAVVIVLALAMRETSSETEIATPTAPTTPSRMVTGETPSQVSYGDAYLTVEAHTALVMGHEERSPSVLVERGAVSFAVAPRERDALVVRAGDVVVRVVGTQFRVARYEERVTVSVEHGLVDVQFRGNVHRLSSGQTWSTPEPTASVLPRTSPVEPTPAPAEPAEPTEPTADNSKKTPNTSSTRASHDAARVKFEKMTQLERHSPNQAMEGYLEISKGSSPWAAVALYSAGRLAFDRNDSRARTFLTNYLKRFPRGVNARDARDLLSRLDGAKP